MPKENSLEYWLDYIQTIQPKEVNLGLNKFDFVEVEEFYQGESIYTEYGRNEMSSINYKLKL